MSIDITSGMPHLVEHPTMDLGETRAEHLNEFALYVSVLPWFNINVLHKFYINIFAKYHAHSNEKFQLRAITCGDFLQSSAVKRIDLNTFILDNATKNALRLQMKNKGEVLKNIGKFMLAYLEECRDHIPNIKYQEAFRIEGGLLINPAAEAQRIAQHIVRQLNQASSNSVKKDSVQYYLQMLDGQPAHGKFSQFLKGLNAYQQGELPEEWKDLDSREEGEHTLKIRLEVEAKRAILEEIRERVEVPVEPKSESRAPKEIIENLAANVCLISTANGSYGTGFLLKGGYILTSNHLFAERAYSSSYEAERPQNRREEGRPAIIFNKGQRNELIIEDFEIISEASFQVSKGNRERPLDYSLLKFERPEDFELSGLDIAQIGKQEEVSIVYYNNRQQQQRFFDGKMVSRKGHQFYYEIETGLGASGAPIFNKKGEVIGIHQGKASASPQRKKAVKGARQQENRKKGIVMEAIAEDVLRNVGVDLFELEKNTEKSAQILLPDYFNNVESQLKLYVNDLDDDSISRIAIEKIIAEFDNAELTEKSSADYWVNIFNQMAYLSLPNDDFRPLAAQIDLIKKARKNILGKERVLKNNRAIFNQLKYLTHWHHLDILKNEDEDFENPPIYVEIRPNGSTNWINITNTNHYLESEPERLNGFLYKKYEIRITNVTNAKLYVAAFMMNNDMEISASPFDNQVIEFNSKNSRYLYDFREDTLGAILIDKYKEIYNWKAEFFHFKFIVSTFEDFSDILPKLVQPALAFPITKPLKSDGYGGGQMDLRDRRKTNSKLGKWGTVKTTIWLNNPFYNEIHGELAENWEDYQRYERLRPFLEHLYPNKKI